MNITNWDPKDPRQRIIVALDVSTRKELIYWVNLLKDYVGYFKIGHEVINSIGGPQAVRIIKKLGGKVFYDIKLPDIGETMKKSARNIARNGADIFNVHATFTVKSMKLVQEVAGNSIVAGVTVLTSFSEEECEHTYNTNIRAKVTSFAIDIAEAGLPAIICSPAEAGMIKNVLQLDLITITPGVRPLWAAPNDQNPDRVMTPAKAIEAGADILVIGRPILQPPAEIGDPIAAVKLILQEIEEALAA